MSSAPPLANNVSPKVNLSMARFCYELDEAGSSSVDVFKLFGRPLVGLCARVFSKRCFAAAIFLDCICVSECGRSHVVQLILTKNENDSYGKDVRVGDVVKVIDGNVDPRLAKPPRACIIHVYALEVDEPWSETLGIGDVHFHQSVFHDDIDASFMHCKRGSGEPKESTSNKFKDRSPNAILQCHASVAERVAMYFNGVSLSSYSKDLLVMLYEDHQDEEDVFKLRRAKYLGKEEVESFLRGIVQRVYFVQPRLKEVSFAQIVAKYLKAVASDSSPERVNRFRRLRCFPRLHEAKLKELLLRESAETPKGSPTLEQSLTKQSLPNICDCVVYADGLYWLGIDTKRMLVPVKSQEVVPSGAYWKLLEIRERYLKDSLNVVEKYGRRSLAIDIGASPGGWSYCLAANFGTRLTFAVDPASHMHELLNKYASTQEGDTADSSVITHWMCRGDAGLERLEKHVSEEGSGSKVAVFVCDMNDDMERAVELVRTFVLNELFERPCLIVVTFKRTCRNKAEFSDRKSKSLAVLENECGLSHLQELHLFANTPQETTVVGQLEEPSVVG